VIFPAHRRKFTILSPFCIPDAVIFLLGLQHQKYRLGYSYDYTLSQIGAAAGSAHEISFSWIFACDKKSRRRGAIKCPSF